MLDKPWNMVYTGTGVKGKCLSRGGRSMESVELLLLFDYYGDLLTERQKLCFDMHYNQDLSLGEIGQELGISRQGVYDNLSRTEALLMNMEQKTGCVRRDMRCRRAVAEIMGAAQTLAAHSDSVVSDAANKILAAVQELEE